MNSKYFRMGCAAYWTIRQQTNSQSVKLWTSQLANS